MTAPREFPLTGEMFIGNDRVRGQAPPRRSRNPHSGEELEPPYGMDDGTAVTEACRRAEAAFDAYRTRPDRHRADFLNGIATNLEEHGEQIVTAVVLETGLAEARARTELARTAGQLRMFADLLGTPEWRDPRHVPAQPHRTPLPRPDLRSRLIPLGPVAVFGASNFPLAFSVAGGDTASALAAGCPVVVKGHLAHLRTSELVGACVADAARQADMPDGVFSLVFGAGNDTGRQLVTDPRIAAVGFTGSRAGGTALTALAQRRPVPIPVYAEMSAINPVFLLPHRLAAATAETAAGYVASLTAGAGQFCTNPGLVLAVEGPDLDTFRKTVTELLREQPAQTMLTTAIAEAYRAGQTELAGIPEVDLLAEGTANPTDTAGVPAVYQTDARTLLTEPRLQEEVFGATSVLVGCANPDDLIQVARHLAGQLTATLHADPDDHALAATLLPLLERRAGRIVYNAWPTGVEVGPATVHGGPYPATSDPRTTSVGTMAINRFLRPVAYQDLPEDLLPA
ncbi:aldehyde dehydrogenase (NADP(+)) [Micromonospora sp. NPDC002575]|uniref:aldehyde dehydrogenase (NADP(+)) n=1 Tax=Micromonospora sp. NPDC002575 TaxID=3364222 RepID=UPI00368B4020